MQKMHRLEVRKKTTIIAPSYNFSFSEGGDSDSGVVLCDSEFSDATIELSDAAIDDISEVNLRVHKEGISENCSVKDLVVLEVNSERDQSHQSLVKRVQLNHR